MKELQGQTLEQFIADCIENTRLIKENNPALESIEFCVYNVPLNIMQEQAVKEKKQFTYPRTDTARLHIARYASGEEYGIGDNDVRIVIFAHSIRIKTKPAEIIEDIPETGALAE
jgi:hypothetical protein